MSQWGATDLERRRPLPGDEVLPRADLSATRAVTIRAAAADVWPWIVQLGQGRGGFYSYDRLESMFGADIHNADTIVSDWQRLNVGDEVALAPAMALDVVRVDPGRAVVLHGGVPLGTAPPPFDFTWAFVLADQPDGSTRLVVRERYAYVRWWAALMVEPTAVVSFVMSQRMLRGIKERAERTAGVDVAASRQLDTRCLPSLAGGR